MALKTGHFFRLKYIYVLSFQAKSILQFTVNFQRFSPKKNGKIFVRLINSAQNFLFLWKKIDRSKNWVPEFMAPFSIARFALS